MPTASSIGAAKAAPINPTVKIPTGPLVLLVAVTLVSACRRDSVASAEAGLPAMRVRAVAVDRSSLPVVFETTGTVRAVQRATIAARMTGSIATLSLKLGDTVRTGDVLLTISAADVSARVTQARAQMAQVERELTRERTLLDTGAGTRDNVKLLEDRLAQTQAALGEAEVMLDYATVRAPFDGTISRKHVEAGDFASPGAPLLQLEGRNAFEIEVGLPESLGGKLAVGSVLDVALAAGAGRFRTVIAEFSSAADSPARSRTAKLAVPSGTEVRSGQFARVFVPGPSSVTLLIPGSAVSNFGQMERVFAVGDRNQASLRLVKTGASHGDRIEILSGLDATDRVVIAPSATLHDGQPLEIIP
ncbi:MAG: efflux RND transporter periplasmic adaptor subunit [Opitutus sp.]|nr:efflux RND transporter periplasmic adaptor subunit [Opitutus sp.]